MFNNKVIWITGASSGLGKFMAYEFAKQKGILALSARRVGELEEVLKEVKKLGGEGIIVPCDILEEHQIESAVLEIIKQYGRLDVAIANAGFGIYGKLEKLTAKDWRRQMDGNVTGLALTAKFAIPHLKNSKGRLALIGSVAAYLPNPNTGAYGASKAAVRSIGQTLQLELKGTGVSCTVIHPGFVDSDITRVDNDGIFHPEGKDPRPKNLMWPTDKAAKVMVKAIVKRKKSFVFTGHGRILAFLGQHFPGVGRWLIGKLG
ncbi:SDR family NAD(P)-dependent oxidoreductase [Aquiflexum lacus]|uniref:SDR family NAD(P)-dependent oxidoreductase n=1 Tax=Aquiflexum lacus TaxID=2483805 RepID=UPI001894FFB9|nr:SDR family NAD(P)-dependent oxidoreductase [Aquiflexum lacus]